MTIFKNFRTVWVLRKEWTWVYSFFVWKSAAESTPQMNKKSSDQDKTSRTTFIFKEILKIYFKDLLVERLRRTNLNWDEVSTLIPNLCMIFRDGRKSSEWRVEWHLEKDHATSRLKENTTLNENRTTQRIDFDTFEKLNTQIRTNLKIMTKWSNISVYSFFWYWVSLRIRFPVMIRVWRMTHEKTGKETRTEVDDPYPLSFKFKNIHYDHEFS